MITLTLTVGGSGPTILIFTSGTIAGVRISPPAEGSLGVLIGDLQQTVISLAPVNGTDSQVLVDVNEGGGPLWLAYTIDCTGGGSLSTSFPGSPTLRVNTGSYLGLEYNNQNGG